MSDKPKRRWFQFHLSTVLIATFMTGGFIGLNFVEQHPPLDDWDGVDQVLGDGFIVSKTSFGFPFPIYSIRVWREPSSIQRGIVVFGIILNLVALVFAIFVAAAAVNFGLRLWKHGNERRT